MTQAYQFRDQSAEQALVLRELPATLDPKDIALRARALRDLNAVWDSASERLRILRGRPLPGSLKPKSPTRKRKVQSGPLFSDNSASTDVPDVPAPPSEP